MLIVDSVMKMRPLTSDSRALIHELQVEKDGKRLEWQKEFPSRQWKCRTLNDLIKRTDKTGSADRKRVTYRPRSVRSSDWSRRHRSRYRTVSQTIVARCCNRWRTH